MSRRERQGWTATETEIIEERIRANPEMSLFAIADHVKAAFPHRTPGSIRSKAARIKEKIGQEKNGGPKNEPPKTSKRPGSIGDSVLEAIAYLEEAKAMLEAVWDDVALLETWAQNTLVLRDRLAYTVEGNGLVGKIKVLTPEQQERVMKELNENKEGENSEARIQAASDPISGPGELYRAEAGEGSEE